MKWLKRLRLLKRLKEQEKQLENLKCELEERDAPVFFVRNYSPGDDGSIEDDPIPVWMERVPDLHQIPLIAKLKFAVNLIEEGVGLGDLMLVLETDKGVFRKMLYNSGDKNIEYNGDSLVAKVNWPTIEVGKDAKIFSAWIVLHGYLLNEVTAYRHYKVEKGDSLNVGFTFKAP